MRIFLILCFIVISFNSGAKSTLNASFKVLFSHKRHVSAFEKIGVSCQDCHHFSLKPKEVGPLAKPIVNRVLKASKKVCHKCHLGKVPVPRISECNLCHKDGGRGVVPKNHKNDWSRRHGRYATMDRDSCSSCHQKNECSNCHMRRDIMNPKVHRPNFRYSHGIKARANPASCTTCHRYKSFCIDCHIGKRK